MSSFAAEWLALREPVDAASRSLRVTRAVAAALPHSEPIDIVDLGAGTGANARFLTGRLPQPQRWLLVDHDRQLLDRAPAMWPSKCVDLRQAVLDAGLFAGRALVTASALLDLVSDAWLQALVSRCREARAAVLFALTYDGRIGFAPADVEDDGIRDLVNRHQRTDKGFGPAAGPGAADRTKELFTAAGYHIEWEPSDWTLTPDTPEIQRQLIDGWAEAATAMAPTKSAAIEGWRVRRLDHVDGGRSRIIVGHEDLGAWIK